MEKGDYMMHHMFEGDDGTLVQLCSKETNDKGENRYGITYVPSGGHSFSWPEKEFRPVTDPILIAMTKAHKNEKEAHDLRVKSRKCDSEARKWWGVVEVLKEAKSNGGS